MQNLNLYSTRTQNTWHWGLALGSAPDARILRWGYQHVGILEPTQTLASGVICGSISLLRNMQKPKAWSYR